MKSELLHLLEKLQTDHPDFKTLMIFRNGSAMVVGNQSHRQFPNLDALEQYAWPQDSPKALECGGTTPLLPRVELNPPATSGYVDAQI